MARADCEGPIESRCEVRCRPRPGDGRLMPQRVAPGRAWGGRGASKRPYETLTLRVIGTPVRSEREAAGPARTKGLTPPMVPAPSRKVCRLGALVRLSHTAPGSDAVKGAPATLVKGVRASGGVAAASISSEGELDTYPRASARRNLAANVATRRRAASRRAAQCPAAFRRRQRNRMPRSRDPNVRPRGRALRSRSPARRCLRR